MVVEGARERRSKLTRSAQASKAGQVSGQVRRGANVSDNATDTLKPKRDTRAEVARETKVPERKLRALTPPLGGHYAQSAAMGRAAPLCDWCFMEKPDAQVRAGLYPTDAQGKKSDRPFLGLLCDECFFRARRPGSAENLWLLKQVRL